jgi:hypothetical protein
MVRNFNSLQRNGAALLFVVLLAALPLVVGCGGTKGSQPEGQEIKVSVNDQQIEMPTSLAAGLTTFTVTNTGSITHSFGITGPSGDLQLEKPLEPGETGTLKVGLDTGTYRVFSPDPNAVSTMQVALVVVPSTESKG